MTRTTLTQLVKEIIDDEKMKSVKFSKFKENVFITGFSPKLSIQRVKKYLEKAKIETIDISDKELKIISHPYNSHATLKNNIHTFLKNAYGDLADNLKIEIKKDEH